MSTIENIKYKAVYRQVTIPRDLAEAKANSILRIIDRALRASAGLQDRPFSDSLDKADAPIIK